MTRANDAAYARPGFEAEATDHQDGLTKREYFAVTILAGMCSSASEQYGYRDSMGWAVDQVSGERIIDDDGNPIRFVTVSSESKYAEAAVEQADALIDELNK